MFESIFISVKNNPQNQKPLVGKADLLFAIINIILTPFVVVFFEPWNEWVYKIIVSNDFLFDFVESFIVSLIISIIAIVLLFIIKKNKSNLKKTSITMMMSVLISTILSPILIPLVIFLGILFECFFHNQCIW